MSDKVFCGKCGKEMTPQNARIRPELFLHDSCLPSELKSFGNPLPSDQPQTLREKAAAYNAAHPNRRPGWMDEPAADQPADKSDKCWVSDGHELYIGKRHGQISDERWCQLIAYAHNEEVAALQAQVSRLEEELKIYKLAPLQLSKLCDEQNKRLEEYEATLAERDREIAALRRQWNELDQRNEQKHREWYAENQQLREQFITAKNAIVSCIDLLKNRDLDEDNYTQGEVRLLNEAAVEAWNTLTAAMTHFEQPRNEPASGK